MEETQEEWEDVEEYEQEPIRREKKKKSKMMPLLIIVGIFASIIIVLLFLGGLGGGVDGVTVTANSIDENDAINIVVITHSSGMFASSPSGNVDFEIDYSNGSADPYLGKIKVSGGGGKVEVPLDEFYIDNGEYIVKVEYEGKSSEDIVNIEKTVKAIVVEAYEIEDTEVLDVTFAFGMSKHIETIGEDEAVQQREIIDYFKEITNPTGNGTLIIKYNNSEDEIKNVYWANFTISLRKITWLEHGKTDDLTVQYFIFSIPIDDFFYEEGTYTAYIEFTNSIGIDKETYNGDDINPEYLKE